MSRIKYTIGDEVAHIDNISMQMRIRGFSYEEKKLRYIIKEKFNTEFVSEKVMEQLNYFLNNERKELIKALELLEKYG